MITTAAIRAASSFLHLFFLPNHYPVNIYGSSPDEVSSGIITTSCSNLFLSQSSHTKHLAAYHGRTQHTTMQTIVCSLPGYGFFFFRCSRCIIIRRSHRLSYSHVISPIAHTFSICDSLHFLFLLAYYPTLPSAEVRSFALLKVDARQMDIGQGTERKDAGS
jgi:hypothetical protein